MDGEWGGVGRESGGLSALLPLWPLLLPPLSKTRAVTPTIPPLCACWRGPWEAIAEFKPKRVRLLSLGKRERKTGRGKRGGEDTSGGPSLHSFC